MDEIRDNEDYIRKNLSKDYEESLKNHKINYLTERENRIKREQEELYNEQKRIEYEDQMERERKNILKKLQYREYIKGIQEKENKLQKEFKEKLIPEEVSLPMNSDERLKKYHNNIYKLSDKADRNRKLFMEYNEKSKNDLYYNYLSKRYTLNNKEANKTIPYNRDLPLTQKFRDDINNEAIKDNTNEVNKNRTFNEHNIINEYNNSYNKYKNLYRQYDEYNRALVQQNIRKKEFMNKQREIQEEKRIEESEKLSQLKQQEKYLENEKKKLNKNFLDMQVNEQIPIKLSKENFEQNNIINSQNNNFHNSKLYDSVPQYSAINKSRFVEVNPYCLKNYDLGKSNLESNPILNPMFNYNYNKYLFGQGVSRSMSTIPTKRNKNIDIITNQIKDEKEEISQSLSPQQYLNRGYNEI